MSVAFRCKTYTTKYLNVWSKLWLSHGDEVVDVGLLGNNAPKMETECFSETLVSTPYGIITHKPYINLI
jgi:hypothetical protein